MFTLKTKNETEEKYVEIGYFLYGVDKFTIESIIKKQNEINFCFR